jgi:thymidylate synthase
MEPNAEFVPLHFAEKLRIVNREASLGIITLWSKIDSVERALSDAGVDLSPDSSRIAVIGNLYGNGIPHLLRNLLYNPQITDLAIIGADRAGSAGELTAFFENGLEEAESLGEKVTRIKGTTRIIDNMLTPDMFAVRPRIRLFGEVTSKKAVQDLADFIREFVPGGTTASERIEIGLPEVVITHYPSEPRAQVVVADSPLAAWRELVFRLARFGHLVKLRKGERQELQNVKVVVRQPVNDDPEELARFGFSLNALTAYQRDMLESTLPEDQAYAYGHRIGAYFGFDALDKFAQRLIENPQDRDCYLALWDSRHDIDADDSPCLVSLFFRVYDEALTLTACYRTHNALDAWIKNVYGLMAAQRIVSDKTGIPPGSITVISHSISIDPSKYDLAQRVCGSKGFSVEMDPNGQFMVEVDRGAGEIVFRHLTEEGLLLHEYRSSKAERIQHELARDCAISDINHALYLGRQLTKAQMALKTGEEYEES